MKQLILPILILWSNLLLAKDLFVGINGNDKNPGTEEQPFATLEKAKQAARTYKNEPVTLYLLPGIYYLAQTLVFTPEDSRTDQTPLTIKALAPGTVVIKGSKRLSLTFKPYKDGIVQATLPARFPAIDQLFINDALQVMARYPNYQPTALPLHGAAADALSAARIRSWKKPAGGYIHALHSAEWGGMHYRITGKETDSTLTVEGGWQNNRPSAMHKTHRYVENIFEELDTAGEWYADRAKRTLYYKPAAGINLDTAVIEVPVLENLIVIKGEPDKPVRCIILSGLRLEHTLRTFMDNKEPLLRSDWTIHRSAAVLFDRTADCSLEHCSLFNMGGNAVFFSNYNQNDVVLSCHIAWVGASAICFVGNPAAVRSPAFRYEQFVPYDQLDKTPGPIGNDFPASCIAINNLVHDIGLTEKQVAGVQLSMTKQISVYNNAIYNTPRAGINVGDGTWGGHDIAYNDVFNTVQETGDHGAFNAWGRDRYWHPKRAVMDSLLQLHPELAGLDAVLTTKIHNNRFRCDNGWDIDLDDGASNYDIRDNVCLNGGLKLREGFHRVVKNNIILNNSFHPHVWFRNSRDTFMHNIVAGPYLPVNIKDWGKGVDSNYFPDEASLRKMQQLGIESHGAAGDPSFETPAAGNYKVQAQSGALSVGFRNFRLSVGVAAPELQALAAQPPLPVLMTASAGAAETHEFLGIKVKNLTTLAERSATGMDKETGVLVLEVPAGSIWYQKVQPNDVILGIDGQPVNNVPELYQAKMKVQWHASTVLTLFRDQHKLELKVPLK
jgi:hypothetical protein